MMTAERTNINELSEEERAALVRATYAKKSYFQSLFKTDKVEIDMGNLSLAFRDAISNLLVEKKLISKSIELELLHENISDEMRAYNFDDGVNKISTYFYEAGDAFMKIYHRFIAFLRNEVIEEPFWFQKTPTLRLHCPNGKNSNHYPRYHTDVGYGHPPEEINIWIPFTHPVREHGFRVMSCEASKQILEQFDYRFGDFIQSAIQDKAFSSSCDPFAKPVVTPLGKLFMFDSRCIHTGEPLVWHSRVSMDMRIMPISQYDNMQLLYQGSGRRKILFAPGHCYHEKHSDFFLNSKEINV